MDDPQDFVDDAMDAAEFRSALRRFLRTSERAARRAGLTPQRHLLLLMIAGAPDGSQSSTVTDLSERLQLAQSTVTELVQRAEESGLVERKLATRDRREFRISLTPEGMRRLGLSFAQLAPERQRLMSVLHTRSFRSSN